MSITLTATSPSWYVLLEGLPNDIAAFKRHFANSGFSFDEIDGKIALAAREFEGCSSGDTNAVIDAATELLNAVNVALRLSGRCGGFELFGVVERRNDAIHRTLLCKTGTARMTGDESLAKGTNARSQEERLVSLMARCDALNEAAHALSLLPVTWSALRLVYETVKGIMSGKQEPKEARSDYVNLIKIGWLSEDESHRLFDTATFYSHGPPKEPIPNRTPVPMSYEEACALVERLFWRLIDELEPG